MLSKHHEVSGSSAKSHLHPPEECQDIATTVSWASAGIGAKAASRKFAEVMSLTWVGSQLTKVSHTRHYCHGSHKLACAC